MKPILDLDHWIEELRNSEKAIIVEGKNDRKALEHFGIGRIFILNKPIYAMVEEVSKSKDVIILTDLDAEGKKLYGSLSSGLRRHGVTIDNRFREFLMKKTKLRQIEGLVSYSATSEPSSGRRT
ncbi:MAG: toprim domain-containing protein [archaeon]